MALNLSLRISKAVRTQLTLKVQQTKGCSHYEERDWTVWSFEEFYKFNTSGRGALGFKDSDPKERIEKIPFGTYNYQEISTSNRIVETIVPIDAQLAKEVVAHVLKHLKKCSESNPLLALIEVKVRDRH